jgi:hypothetical protein
MPVAGRTQGRGPEWWRCLDPLAPPGLCAKGTGLPGR